MRLLYIINNLRKGGKERQFVELLCNISNYSYVNYYVIILGRDIEYEKFLDYGIPYINIQRKNIYTILSIWKNIVKFKPDIIHSWCSLCTFYCLLISKLLKIKLIDGSIRYSSPIKRFSKYWILSKINFLLSDKVVANSYSGMKTYSLLVDDKYSVIYNGFDFNRIVVNEKVQLKKDLNIMHKFIVGMVANFVEAKDHKTLVYAIIKLLRKKIDLGCVFIGSGFTEDEIKSEICNEFKNNFYFLGSRNEVENIIQLFDIGVLLTNTINHAEGISNSIIEIMACGIPVIATKAGGNLEIIKDGINGLFVNPFDEIDVYNKLLLLKNDSQFRINLGEEARKTIKNNFSISTMTNKYIELYSMILK
ncbi:MAG: glycosyltransferase [Candidatus Kapaibacterium sp.]